MTIGTRRKRREKRKIIVCSILYKALLDFIFVFWVSKRFSYSGFSFSFSVPCFVISVLAAVLAATYVTELVRHHNTANIVLIFLIYMYYYPQCVLCAFSRNDLLYFTFVTLYFAMMAILNRVPFKPMRIPGKENIFLTAFVILGLVVIFVSGVYTGFRITFVLDDYYEYRLEAREYSMPFYLTYPFQWAKNFLPIGTLYALIKKKPGFAVYGTICQILCFSFNGKKSVLFTCLLVFVVYFFYREKYLKNIAKVFVLLMGATLLEMAVRGGESFIATKYIRRMMLVPAYLGWVYFDFFSAHELDLLRSSVLRRFGYSSPYAESIPRMIGRLYYASDGEMNANTGLCGDAFSNFGWYSLLIYPLLTILVLKLLSSSMEGLDNRIAMLTGFLVSYMLMSGTLFKCILSGGLILITILMSCCHAKQERAPLDRSGRLLPH